MAEDFTPEEMELLRALVVEVRELKDLFGAIDARSSAIENLTSSIKQFFDEEYEAARAILARLDRIDANINARN